MNMYGQLASQEIVSVTKKSLVKKGYTVFEVADKTEALEKIKTLIPRGASVMNGSSVTLEQIGYLELLKSGDHPWVDMHAKITAEDDDEKRHKLRRESVLSEYYLGSVHGLASNGEFVIASNSGSQLPHVVFTSPNLVFVVSTKKIVEGLDAALRRLEDYVLGLEDKHMMELYNVHTAENKVVLFKGEKADSGRTITFILVNEDLGF